MTAVWVLAPCFFLRDRLLGGMPSQELLCLLSSAIPSVESGNSKAHVAAEWDVANTTVDSEDEEVWQFEDGVVPCAADCVDLDHDDDDTSSSDGSCE